MANKKSVRILITGAHGFIGQSMYKFLSQKSEFKITNTNRSQDLRDFEICLKLTKNQDHIYHFAASMGGIGFFSQQHYYPALDNFTIDINLLRAAEANGVKRIFYPSSACAYPVYRMNEGALLSEKMLSEPADPDQMYGWQKLTMLKLLEYSPLDCRVGLLHTIYGPGQSYKGIKAKFPPQIAYKAIVAQKSHEISVWGNGKQTRTFLYINDAVRKIYEVMNKKKYFGPVNIGSSKEVTVNEVVEICCQILNIKPKIIHDLDKPVGPLRRRCSNRKFNQHYKTGEETSLKEGFRRIINHILNTET